MEKLSHGVLELDTPIGPRYLQPNFSERVWLMWTFRNFFSLPHKVLRPREQRLIDRLCGENRFIPVSATGVRDLLVIGRVERRVSRVGELLPMRKPVSNSRSVAEPGREAASA